MKSRSSKVKSKQRKSKAQRKASTKHRLSKHQKYLFVSQLALVIKKRFADLFERLEQLPDNRKRPQYRVNELIVSALLMFLFKQQSRNQADSTAKNLDYQDNIQKIFGIRVASMDTVHTYLKSLPHSELEKIKQDMIRQIIKSKVLQKYKYRRKYYMVVIDGTAIQSYDYEPYAGCPYKKYKNKTVWTAYALEAKIVTETGFAISLATEWVENNKNGIFDKQDCELKAFVRLANRIKKEFPRLNIMLLLDGLYPNNTVFNVCEKNNWLFAITLKDGNLKSVQEQIYDKELFKEFQSTNDYNANSTHWIKESYKIYNNIQYREHKLTVVETISHKQSKNNPIKDNIKTRFVHITNENLIIDDVRLFSKSARLRWKIENEGFNEQKNNDYNLEHKFSRKNFNATKNYYQLLQMATIINQFVYKLKKIQNYLKTYGLTQKSLILKIFMFLNVMIFDDIELINSILQSKEQLRY